MMIRISPHAIHSLNKRLIKAAKDGSCRKMELLLDRGADVQAEGNQPLLMSVAQKDLKKVTLLLDRGADIHASEEGAFSIAMMQGFEPMMQLLLDRGADLNQKPERILGLAVRHGKGRSLPFLLSHGMDKLVCEGSGYNALITGVELNHLEAVRLLLDHGADVSGKQHAPIQRAVFSGHFSMVQLLIEYGADASQGLSAALVLSSPPYQKMIDWLNQVCLAQQEKKLFTEELSKPLHSQPLRERL